MPLSEPPSDDPNGKRRRRESDIDRSNPPLPFDDNTPTTQNRHATCSTTRDTKKKRVDGSTTMPNKKAPGGAKVAAQPRPNTSDGGAATEDGEKSDTAEISAPSIQASTASASKCVARLEEKYGDLTSQEVLDARAAKWTSQVYKHFNKPVLATKKDGTITTHFVCIVHPSKHVDRAPTDESTGNLNRHFKACILQATATSEMITAYAQGATYSYAHIARRHRPFTIVEDPEFKELLHMLYVRMEIPSRVTVSCDLKDIFQDSRARVKGKLQVWLLVFLVCHAIHP
ncbi:hypothetical protein LXA43DRAFT_1066610 [Ganoderma leucocontextum]|nr:hypothetical protein LXA43DRAFT_1066610 [Ganoderma leucocontextum]